MNDINNPNCFSCMYKHISNETNTPYSNKISIDPNIRFEKVKSDIYCSHVIWVINGRKATVKKRLLKGGIPSLDVRFKDDWVNEVNLPFDTVIDEIYYEKVNIDLLMDKAEMTTVGKYRECHGGGWYSDTPLYEVLGRYFAGIECTGHCSNPIKLNS